jgi:hypothetical protein
VGHKDQDLDYGTWDLQGEQNEEELRPGKILTITRSDVRLHHLLETGGATSVAD